MSSTWKSSSLSSMRIGECVCCCLKGGGMSATEVVGVQTKAWMVDIVNFLGVNWCVNACICI